VSDTSLPIEDPDVPVDDGEDDDPDVDEDE